MPAEESSQPFAPASCLHESADGHSLAVSWPEFIAGLGRAKPGMKVWRITAHADGTFSIRSRGRDDAAHWELNPSSEDPIGPIYGNAVYDYPDARVQDRATAVYMQMVRWAQDRADAAVLATARGVSPTAAAYNLARTDPRFRRLAETAPMAAAILFARAYSPLARTPVNHSKINEFVDQPPFLIACGALRHELVTTLAQSGLRGLQAVDEWTRRVEATDDFGFTIGYPDMMAEKILSVLIKYGSPELVKAVGTKYGNDEWAVFHWAAQGDLEVAGGVLQSPGAVIDMVRSMYTPEFWGAADSPAQLVIHALSSLKDIKGECSLDRLHLLLSIHRDDWQSSRYREFTPSPIDGLQVGPYRLVQLRDTFMLGAEVEPHVDFANAACAAGEIRVNVIDSAGDTVMTLRLDADHRLITSYSRVPVTRLRDVIMDQVAATVAHDVSGASQPGLVIDGVAQPLPRRLGSGSPPEVG